MRLLLPAISMVTTATCRRFIVISCSRLTSQNANSGSSSSRNTPSGEPPNGIVYDKKPVRLTLEAGKLYSWCTCGHSKKQPYCDNSHRAVNELPDADRSKPPFRSHKFQVDVAKQYALCNCKQTAKRPFCDGTHKQQWIQEAVTDAK